MLKRTILLVTFFSISAYATNPFSSNNFTLKAEGVRDDERQIEIYHEYKNSELSDNKENFPISSCEMINFELLDDNHEEFSGKEGWPPTEEPMEDPYYVSQEIIDKFCKKKDLKDRISFVSPEIVQDEHGRDAFYGLAFSPLGESKNFDVGLYKGNLYFWGKNKLPFYLSYGEPKAESEKDEASETLIDKGAGLQISVPLLWSFDSGIHHRNSESYKQSRIVFGTILRGVAKEITGKSESEYVYGFNMSAVLQYNAYLEVLSLAGEGNKVEPGSLNIELNYTYHDYSSDALKTVANNLDLLETDKFSDSFNTYGYTITAEIGTVISLKYQWEKVDDPIFGTDEISRFVLEKRF